MLSYRIILLYGIGILLTLVILFFPYLVEDSAKNAKTPVLRVLTYASFIKEWGPGPAIARQFKKETGIEIKWINARNAGLILERLKFKSRTDQPDAIIGFDQFSILEARKISRWRDVHEIPNKIKKNLLPEGSVFHDFVAYDWGPMSFVYKADGEIQGPRSLDDLVNQKYKKTLILQDPRMSSPGLQFLFWILNQKGEEEAFDYLDKLKDSIKVMAPSWSTSYSLFKSSQATLVFSYFTSPYYHLLEEKDDSYRVATFEHPHPVQVEYAGIPMDCNQCEWAETFLKFIVREDIQKIIMQKNYMFPVEGIALEGTEFKVPQNIKYFDPVENWSLIRKKKELVEKWKEVFY